MRRKARGKTEGINNMEKIDDTDKGICCSEDLSKLSSRTEMNKTAVRLERFVCMSFPPRIGLKLGNGLFQPVVLFFYPVPAFSVFFSTCGGG